MNTTNMEIIPCHGCTKAITFDEAVREEAERRYNHVKSQWKCKVVMCGTSRSTRICRHKMDGPPLPPQVGKAYIFNFRGENNSFCEDCMGFIAKNVVTICSMRQRAYLRM